MSTSSTFSAPRGIDHIVIAARNLDELAARYAALGFKVGPRNRHPWGTENHIVQFAGSFLELIGVGDEAAVPPPAPRNFSFGAFVRDGLRKHEGALMLALESTNAVGDADLFRRLRIGDYAPFQFERRGRNAAGNEVTVAFTLAFATAPNAPDVGFFVCQQHKPQHFWNASAQMHDNGVQGIASVVFVTEDPSDYHEFLGDFVNQREMRATSYGLELETGRGLIEVLSPAAFAFRFGERPPLPPGLGLQIGAIEFKAGVPAAGARTVEGLEVVPAQAAGGVVLAFGR